MRAKTLINIKIAELSEEIQSNPSDIQPTSQILVSLQENIDQLDIKIADICALKNMKIIKDHYESVTLGDGSFNIPKMWGLKKKLSLKSSEGPSAKKDKSGNLITSKNGLLALYKNTYMDMSHKNIRPEYEHLKSMKETLFELRYELASGDKSENWTIDKIEKICKSLKNSKARDECGFIYELFKPPYAGSDVYKSLTKMFNLIKNELVVPDFFELMSITSLYKNKAQKVIYQMKGGFFIYQRLDLFLIKLSIQMFVMILTRACTFQM